MTGRRVENRLTREDTVALWHAVRALSDLLEASRNLEGIHPEDLADDEARLVAARRALRKANRLREEMGRRFTANAQAKHKTTGSTEA